MSGWLWETYTKMTGMIPMLSQAKSAAKENSYSYGTIPAGNYTGIGYNGSVWAAVISGSTTAASSTDGITWTARTSSSNKGWSGVGNIGSTFCSVSSGGAQTSTDGVTWTARTMPSSQGYSLLYHYSGIAPNGFLAVSGGYACYSTNGITWTETAWPNSRSRDYAGVAWNGSTWCFVVDNFSYWCYTSTNGTTWTERRMPIRSLDYDQEGSYFTGPGWNGTYFIVIRGYGTDVVRSTDGVTWDNVLQNGPPEWSMLSGPQYNPMIGTGSYVTKHYYGGGASSSTDGAYWRTFTVKLPDSAPYPINAVAYSATKEIAIGNGAIIYTSKTPGTRG